ncbi:hypothetical protein GIB67_011338 [Kingdonia uniflora]|uniref:Uncharacterized protein n=1 Tax=Kingdonia uniflora TaxID=39325 RepID=A0A7J7MNZ2_9MAGN|nr:hypothetical protein GIB67_011338 [Kingdonia uniflora]
MFRARHLLGFGLRKSCENTIATSIGTSAGYDKFRGKIRGSKLKAYGIVDFDMQDEFDDFEGVTKVARASSGARPVKIQSDELKRTLARLLVTNHSYEEDLKHAKKEKPTDFVPKDTAQQRSSLTLEVISGPSGVCCSVLPTNKSKLPFTLGRVSSSDLLLKDAKKLDSLDCSESVMGMGVGVGAAETASKMLPEIIASILSVSEMRERVSSRRDASDALKSAFFQTEAAMHDHQYEGCTVTVLLVWADGQENFCAVCKPRGFSLCSK